MSDYRNMLARSGKMHAAMEKGAKRKPRPVRDTSVKAWDQAIAAAKERAARLAAGGRV